ncbi:hypothetical protein MARPO_0107s0016, partial [Marchantia polymorpha]
MDALSPFDMFSRFELSRVVEVIESLQASRRKKSMAFSRTVWGNDTFISSCTATSVHWQGTADLQICCLLLLVSTLHTHHTSLQLQHLLCIIYHGLHDPSQLGSGFQSSLSDIFTLLAQLVRAYRINKINHSFFVGLSSSLHTIEENNLTLLNHFQSQEAKEATSFL